jgi:hypothetical protein
MNGLASLTFDGTNDRLVCTSPATDWKFLHGASSAVYVAYRQTVDQDCYTWTTATTISNASANFGAHGVAVTNRLLSSWIANGSGTMHLNGTGAGLSASAGTTINAKGVMWRRYTLNTNLKQGSSVLSEQTCALTGSASSSDPPASFSVGYGGSGWGSFFGGQISEILVYNAAVGDADHALLKSYLETRYNV